MNGFWRVDDDHDLVRAYEALSVYKSAAQTRGGWTIPRSGWSPQETYEIVYEVMRDVPDVPPIWILDAIQRYRQGYKVSSQKRYSKKSFVCGESTLQYVETFHNCPTLQFSMLNRE